ncbi:MAG: PAS domain S-box protein [Chloroflexi bacterium]|nr:PAS domain S-box protein [Chloroflexota bacterium]
MKAYQTPRSPQTDPSRTDDRAGLSRYIRRLGVPPHRARSLFFVLGTTALYAVLFVPVFRALGPQTVILSLVPVLSAGSFFGMRAGALVGFSIFFLNFLLVALVAQGVREEYLLFQSGVLFGSLSIALVGTLIGRFHDLHERVKRELAERQRIEGALWESEEKSRLLMENASEAVVVAQDGMLKFVNPEATRLSGYSQEELVSRPFISFVYPEDREAVARYQRKLLQGVRLSRIPPFRIVHRDGSVRWVETNVMRILWEDRPAILHLLRDVTQRQRVWQMLKESEARFRMITEESLAGVYIFQDGKFRYVNPALARTFGYTPEELIDKMGPLDLTFPEDHERVQQYVAKRLTGEVEFAHYVFRGRRKDGSCVYCEVLGRRVDYRGRPAIVGTLLDVTERKQAEEQLQRTNAQLRAALKARDEMIGNVSHELRTPLTLIKGYVELLKEGLLGPLTAAQVEAVTTLDVQSERLRYMVDRLLMLQTLDVTAVQATELRLEPLLHKAIRAWETRSEESGVQFLIDVPPDLPPLVADSHLLYQVLCNLIDNAVKFSPGGGQVRIRVWVEQEAVLMAISDQGVGIPPDKLEQIFECFYQVDGGSTRRFGGMGIGLALCRRIVELHGGRIWAESEGEGRGSTFYVMLPLRPPREVEHPLSTGSDEQAERGDQEAPQGRDTHGRADAAEHHRDSHGSTERYHDELRGQSVYTHARHGQSGGLGDPL